MLNIFTRLIIAFFITIFLAVPGVYGLYFLLFNERFENIEESRAGEVKQLQETWNIIFNKTEDLRKSENVLLSIYSYMPEVDLCIKNNNGQITNCDAKNISIIEEIPDEITELITATERVIGPVKLEHSNSNSYFLVIKRTMVIKTILYDILYYQKGKVLIVIISCIAIWFITAKYISEPLHQLIRITKALEKGNLHVKIPDKIISRSDEIGTLSRAVNSLQEALENSYTAQRNLIMWMSHEINTPLTRIRLIGSVLQKNNSDNSRYIDTLIKSCDELSSISKQMMEYSRLDSGALKNEHQNVNMAKILADETSHCQVILESKNLTLKINNEENPIININLDAAHIIVRNILQNVINHSIPDTQVNIYSSSEQGYWFFQCINASAPTKIKFLPQKNPITGYGIGLKIVRQLVQTNKGDIHIRNSRGIFHIWLRIPFV